MADGSEATAASRPHLARVYDRDADLARDVAAFIAAGAEAGEAALLIATPEHADAIRTILADSASPIVERLHTLDAAQTVARISGPDGVDADAFREVIGDALRSAGRNRAGVRAFGELVALLWARSDIAGAILVEDLWNELLADSSVSLYCGYPSNLLLDPDLFDLASMCQRHTQLISPASYHAPASIADDAASLQEVSRSYIPTPYAPRAARRFVAAALDAWDLNSISAEAAVVVAEMATNAVLHAGSAFEVRLARSRATVTISVRDTSDVLPSVQPPSIAPGGRGVAIIDGVASRWGVRTTARDKVVWAELRTG